MRDPNHARTHARTHTALVRVRDPKRIVIVLASIGGRATPVQPRSSSNERMAAHVRVRVHVRACVCVCVCVFMRGRTRRPEAKFEEEYFADPSVRYLEPLNPSAVASIPPAAPRQRAAARRAVLPCVVASEPQWRRAATAAAGFVH